MGTRALLGPRGFRSLLDDGGDPDATLDVGRAQRIGGAFWAIGGAIALLLLPFSPPTEAIGGAGWIVAAVGLIGCFAMAARRFDRRVIPSIDEIFVMGWFGLAAVAALVWLAGGESSPYDELLVLPALYAAAIHSTRRAGVFLAVVVVVTLLPLAYDDLTRAATVELAAHALMLVALALVVRVLMTALRVQRGRLVRARTEAEQQARRDALTGLGNRLAFQETLVREVARSRRSARPLAVLLGDLENFKAINDSLGHVAGDECLRLAARRIAQSARLEEECFRWGGDEFAVLLPDTPPEEAEPVRERMCGSLGEDCGAPLKLVCAVTSLREGQGPEDLLAEVDRLLMDLKARAR